MAKPQHEYESEAFLKKVEEYAKKGYTDKEIAYELDLHPATFSEHKTVNHPQIGEALARGRAKINNIVRQRLLAVGLGGLKTKRVSKRKSEMVGEEVMYEEETELAPNPQVLSTWLFNHDEEWRASVMEGKRLDVTTNGKDVNANPLVFVSADDLEKEQLDGLIKAQLGGSEIDADSGNDTGS